LAEVVVVDCASQSLKFDLQQILASFSVGL